MSSIEVIEIESGFAFKFPFELKDDFRSTFKSAKWNAYYKRWEVGKRSKSKIEQWIDIVKDYSDKITETKKLEDEVKFTEREIERKKEAMEDKIKSLINTKKLLNESLENIKKGKEILFEIEDKLNEISIEVKNKAQEEEEAKKELVDKLSKIIDFHKINSAHYTLKRRNGYGQTERERFDKAINKIDEEITKLDKAGLFSEGLHKLSHMNFNRPDRDNPFDVNMDDILKIRKKE